MKKENKRNIIQKDHYEIKNNNSMNKSFEVKIRHKPNNIYEMNTIIENRIIFKFYIIMNLIMQALPILYHIQYKLSTITLKISGTGTNNIFSSEFPNDSYPNEVYVNEQLQIC